MVAPTSPVQRLLRLSRSNKRVLSEALLTLMAASLTIRLLPFRKTAALMRGKRGVAGEVETPDRAIAQCRWAIGKWATRVPWRVVCFQRGLTLHLMLRRRGIPSVLHYGVAQDAEKGLRAHVWVSVDGRDVLGGEEAAEFTCVASFPELTER